MKAPLARARFSVVAALADCQAGHAMWLKALGRTRDAAWLGRFARDPQAVKPGPPIPPYKNLSQVELQAIGADLESLR